MGRRRFVVVIADIEELAGNQRVLPWIVSVLYLVVDEDCSFEMPKSVNKGVPLDDTSTLSFGLSAKPTTD